MTPPKGEVIFFGAAGGIDFLQKGKLPSLHGESSRGEGMPLSYEIKPRAKNKKPPIG